jgi:hypothetical protein
MPSHCDVLRQLRARYHPDTKRHDEVAALDAAIKSLASPPFAGTLTDASDASPSQLAAPEPELQPTQPEEAGSATP